METSGLCIVTGASSGIGQAIAQELVAAGHRVVGTARNPALIAAIPGLEAVALDLTQPRSIQALATKLAARGESVALLVNNAGYAKMGPLAEIGYNDWERQFRTNLIGPLCLTAALFGLMKQGTVIVDVGSVSGDFVTPFAGAYCASKAALHAADASLRLELKPFGIHVLSIRPGGIQSNFGARAAATAGQIPRESAFSRFGEGIALRANESQARASTAESLAKFLVKNLAKKRLPAVLRFGRRSRSLLILQALLPRPMLTRILSKKYGLI